MALYTVSSGQTINAADINQLVNVLQCPSGSQEAGQYFIVDWANSSNEFFGQWISTRSRGSTPVSVSVDTSLGLSGNANPPSTNHLGSSGFQLYTSSTSASNNIGFGGNWTVQY
jgi:hypothetical protein